MPVLLAASVGGPYMVNNPPEWLQGNSNPEPQAAATEKANTETSVLDISTPPQASVFSSSTPLGGHKGLYSTAFYSEEEFWAAYNGPAYARLKTAYDPEGRLSGLYEKCVRGR